MTRYDMFRRRIAPIAFLLGLALIARSMCNQEHRTHATIVLDLGDVATTALAVDAELKVGGESIALFHRAALPGHTIGPCKFEVAMPADDGTVAVDIDLDATHRKVTRPIHADEGATVTVHVGSSVALP